MIRLPQGYIQIIGQRVHIYTTDHDGQLAFLVVPYAEETVQSLAAPNVQVAKPSLETDVKKASLLSNPRKRALGPSNHQVGKRGITTC